MRSHGILYAEPPESPSHNWRLLHFLMSQLQQVRKDGSIEMNDLAPGIKPKNITEALTISEGMTVLIVLYIYIYLVIYFSHCKSHCCFFFEILTAPFPKLGQVAALAMLRVRTCQRVVE